MRLIFGAILLLFLISSGSAAQNEVIRDISTVDNEIHVTISPEPYINFSLPGYYVEETIPYKYVFKSTTADFYIQDGQVLRMLRLMPTFSNRNITYILTNYGSKDSIDITGLYMDKNKNEGVIVNVEKRATESSSNSASSSEGDGWTHGDSPTASDKIITTSKSNGTIEVEAQQVQSPGTGASRQQSGFPILIILIVIISSVSMLAYGYEDELRATLMLKRKPRTFHFIDSEPAQENVELQGEPNQIP